MIMIARWIDSLMRQWCTWYEDSIPREMQQEKTVLDMNVSEQKEIRKEIENGTIRTWVSTKPLNVICVFVIWAGVWEYGERVLLGRHIQLMSQWRKRKRIKHQIVCTSCKRIKTYRWGGESKYGNFWGRKNGTHIMLYWPWFIWTEIRSFQMDFISFSSRTFLSRYEHVTNTHTHTHHLIWNRFMKHSNVFDSVVYCFFSFSIRIAIQQ